MHTDVKVVGMDGRYRRVVITCYGDSGDRFSFAVPGWGSNRVVLVKKADVPTEVAVKIKNTSRVSVEATVDCDDYRKCQFRNWEVPK